MIAFKHSGDFKNTEAFLDRSKKLRIKEILNKYGSYGVEVLRNNTPKDTGETANLWSYKVYLTKNGWRLTWYNSNQNEGIPIVILLHYGHATRNGGYVQGVDFINPSLQPIFNNISNDIWREVTGK